MKFFEWVSTFRELHQKMNQGLLSQEARTAYTHERDDFLRGVAALQQLTLLPGQTERRLVRITRAVQADLRVNKEQVHAFTLDLSRGGFSSLVDRPPEINAEVGFSLLLPGGPPITGRGRVADSKATPGGSHRISVVFLDLSASDRERLEALILETVLARLS